MVRPKKIGHINQKHGTFIVHEFMETIPLALGRHWTIKAKRKYKSISWAPFFCERLESNFVVRETNTVVFHHHDTATPQNGGRSEWSAYCCTIKNATMSTLFTGASSKQQKQFLIGWQGTYALLEVGFDVRFQQCCPTHLQGMNVTGGRCK